MAKGVGYLALVGMASLLLLELCYRYYLFDFYKNNFRLLNPPALFAPNDQRPAILAMGDSFTADPQSYVRHLRDSLPAYRIFNAGVPGTTVKQAALMVNKRIRQVKPAILIYQIYVGNDLFEFRHPQMASGISPIRQSYWWLADRIWVLGYINSRLPHIRRALTNDLPNDYQAKKEADFDAARYSRRTKLQLLAEPDLVENTAYLTNGRAADFQSYSGYLSQIIDAVPEGCKMYLLVVPHCMQISKSYQQRLQQIGASSTANILLRETNYPFLDSIMVKSDVDKVLNALPVLRAAEQQQPVYFANDPHLNPFGQKILGGFLINHLRQ